MEELWTRALTDLVGLLEKWAEVIPPYLFDLFNRYAAFGIFKEWFVTLLCLTVFILCIVWWIKVYKASDWDTDCIWAMCAILLIPVIFSIVGFFMSGADLLEAIFLPEVYVIHDLQWCSHC